MAENQEKGTLAQSIEKTRAFLDPQNLADLLIKYEGEVAVLAIDVQATFCDPQQAIEDDLFGKMGGNAATQAASERISSLIPEFRKAGIPIYAVYYADDGEYISPYKYVPAKDDTIILKNEPSAFKGGDIEDILKKDHKKLLLTCGFNLSACVSATVEDALSAGFEVCLMDDLIKDGLGYTEYEKDISLDLMQRGGAKMTTSETALAAVRRLHP